MTERIEQEGSGQITTRRDFVSKLGAGIFSVAMVPALLQSRETSQTAELWQPNWVGLDRWPDGPAGQRQIVTATLGAGQVATLSGGYVKLFDRDNKPYLYESTQAVGDVIIPVVDGGANGGTLSLEVANLQNWAGIADKPEAGRSLTTVEMVAVAISRISEARKYGADRVTFVWMDLSAQRQVKYAATIFDLDDCLERLGSRLK